MQFTKGRILCTEDDVDTRELTEKLHQFDLRHPFFSTQERRTRLTGKQLAFRVLKGYFG